MVDVDRRMTGLNQAHKAGLRRLSARASSGAGTVTATTQPIRNGLISYASLADEVISHLRQTGVEIEPGLTDSEFAKTEAEFGFYFPPDIRAILSAGLPIGPGFPDWRTTGSRAHIKSLINLPIAAMSLQISGSNNLWSRSWGVRPADPERAIGVVRNYLKKAPLLIPVFSHCYLPCSPNLAGNPIFYVDENRVFVCGFDLSDFFEGESFHQEFNRNQNSIKFTHPKPISQKFVADSCSSSSISSESSNSSLNFSRTSHDSGDKTTRWIEFWTDAAMNRCRVNSSCSTPERSSRIPKFKMPNWVENYIVQIGSVLRESGWGESDVNEIIDVSASGFFENGDIVLIDNQAVLDALLLKAGRFSDSLRKAGWSSEEVTDALGFDFRPERERKMVKTLSPELVEKIGKLVESVRRR